MGPVSDWVLVLFVVAHPFSALPLSSVSNLPLHNLLPRWPNFGYSYIQLLLYDRRIWCPGLRQTVMSHEPCPTGAARSAG
jgi:hypothetical protein